MEISVIIPVRNEASTIRQLLGSLQNQTLTPAEIIITDAGSTDETASIVAAFDAGGLPIQLIRAGEGYPGRGRNRGAAAAENEWLAFIDAGVYPEPQWLELLAAQVQSGRDVEVVYGSFQPITDTLFKECAAIAFVPPPTEVNGAMMRTRSIASALMRKSVWQSVDGFPEDLRSAEDLLFMDKVEAAGFKIAHAPKAVVHWNLQPTLAKTFKRFVAYSRSNIRAGLWSRWQRAIFQRYGLFLLLVIAVLVFAGNWRMAGLVAVAIAWLLMMLARSVIVTRRNRHCYPARLGRNLARLSVLVPILAVIDLAAIAGSLQWLLTDRTYSAASRGAP